MKMFKTMLMTGALAVTSLVPAFAQSDSMRVNVPFAFLVGTQKMAAGQYDVQSQMTNGLVLIQGEGHGVAVVTSPFSAPDPNGKPNLVFLKTDEGPVLVRVQLLGEPARALPSHPQTHVKFADAR
ncbi:MAG TPA: hypothetical protein VG168_00140 [Bryobacteraceae bacterium]|jgi:hypothetical protein|nr:hypothetical protein [Bryobacteraceae bacterium]